MYSISFVQGCLSLSLLLCIDDKLIPTDKHTSNTHQTLKDLKSIFTSNPPLQMDCLSVTMHPTNRIMLWLAQSSAAGGAIFESGITGFQSLGKLPLGIQPWNMVSYCLKLELGINVVRTRCLAIRLSPNLRGALDREKLWMTKGYLTLTPFPLSLCNPFFLTTFPSVGL